MVSVTGPFAVCCGFELSVTLTVRFAVPAAVGVPLTVQPFAPSVNPAGSVPPVIVQLYGAVPPLAPIVPVYGVPTVPSGRFVVVSINPPEGLIVRLTGPLALCCGFEESVALTVKFAIPAAVGVPLTVQPFAPSVNPAGSVPPVIAQV